ncbi:MAG: class I SAM-dependent methyltransferase [Patescibacteria group bacterium]
MDFAQPQNNVSELHLTSGQKVADFGCGVGAYSLALAEAVGSEGRVYAVDVQKDILDKLKAESRESGLTNIEVIRGNLDKPNGSGLAEASVTAVVLANVLFQSESKYILMREAFRVLAPGGKILIIDWQDSFGGLGPVSQQVVNKIKAEEIMTEAGFELDRDFMAGAHHYGLLGTKPE